jgi:ribonuclease VapC
VVIDPSALLAVLSGAAEVEAPAGRMAEAPILRMSAASLLEACLVAAGSRFSTASDGVEGLCHALDIEDAPLESGHLLWALRGWREFGKGRYRAGLNRGDCFSDGLARARNMPVHYKGNDFAHTDVQSIGPQR